MHERHPFDYAIVRIVPRVERGEFLNAGVILFCSTQAFLQARLELDRSRLEAMAPGIDLRMVESHLEVIPRVCAGGQGAGPIGELSQRERFHWLVAPRSTVIQPSPVHAGVDGDLPGALQKLFDKLVRSPLQQEPGMP
ncbi:MAG: DUF3037 domain-containing protein [Acidobacteriota bacterium]